jgi:hypothetical protein
VGDFDFLVGHWNVANRWLKERLAGCSEWADSTSTCRCWSLFEGAANVDEYSFPDGRYGMTLRLLDRATNEWSLYWSDSRLGTLLPPVVGKFDGAEGRFYGEEDHSGSTVRVRYIWSRITPTSARWEQAFSTDGEKTWETNWIMDFTRVDEPEGEDSDGAGEPVV